MNVTSEGLKATTKRTSAWRIVSFAVIVLLCMTLGLAGCAGATGSRQQTLTAKITTPDIGSDGVLKVGVNSSNPPYAGLAKGSVVGIDVDIASALAAELGLKVEVIDMSYKDPNELLANGTVDVMMGVEQDGTSISNATIVGPYLWSGPALFQKTRANSASDIGSAASIDVKSLAGTKVAAQKESLSASVIDHLAGKGTANPVETLEDAIKAVDAGTSTYAAADAVRGSYLSINYKDISCVQIISDSAIGISCAVASSKPNLEEKLKEALRSLRENGVIVVILSKWLGPISAKVVENSTKIVSQNASDLSPTNTVAGDGQTTAEDSGVETDELGAAEDGTDAEIDTGEDLPDPANAGGV